MALTRHIGRISTLTLYIGELGHFPKNGLSGHAVADVYGRLYIYGYALLHVGRSIIQSFRGPQLTAYPQTKAVQGLQCGISSMSSPRLFIDQSNAKFNCMEQQKLSENIELFIGKMNGNVSHRYRSFDQCYHYFRSNIRNVGGKRTEESCMRLWAYLASWGMLRGSSELLQYNPSVLVPLVEHINSTPAFYWNIDVPDYNMQADEIVNMYEAIEYLIKKIEKVSATDTLVTKIMLGVFGNIPAFDQYFKGSFKAWLHELNEKMPMRFNKKMLELLHLF